MDYDYNTSRSKLILPEYGRNIQKMVEYIMTVEDREERNKLAHAVIIIMGNMNPHLRDINDFKHKLWDHLAIMSDFKLDIDYPYEIPKPEEFMGKPRRVYYNNNDIRYRHYGRVIEMMIEEASKFPEGEEKDESLHFHELIHILQWNELEADKFILAYALGLLEFGYSDSPFERIAYELQDKFDSGMQIENLEATVRRDCRLQADTLLG